MTEGKSQQPPQSTRPFGVGVITIVAAMCVAAAAVARLGSIHHPPNHSAPERALGSGRIDLNAASADELRALPGIGETLAVRLAADRDEHGPYKSIDELNRVPGVGPLTIERLRPLLFIEQPE